MKKGKEGFSIIIALWIVLIITLIAIYIFEYIIPFSRNVKGIENATKSYYLALSWEEDALFYIRKNGIWAENNFSSSGAMNYEYTITALWSALPTSWHGTSDFDKDWSKINSSTPVQVFLPVGVNFANVKVYFRVPGFSDNLVMSSIWDIINWQISSKTDILNANDWERFTSSSTSICNSSNTFCAWNSINSRQGFNLDNTTSFFSNFYSTKCLAPYDCVLKFSVIDNLIAKKETGIWPEIKIPYIEYKIDFGTSSNIPSNIIWINVIGTSYNFRKDFTFYYPQSSLIGAYDFTVLQ